ncbi:hypothetical protein E4U59_006994 [Claviceps monticola]|nr:hypothetical protein E4U59_006994 [Claviceps monticola]
MAPSTRVSSKSTETPDPQINTNQEVPFNTSDSSNSATTSTDGLADLERQLAMAQLRAKIAQADSQRRAFEKENAADEQGATIPGAALTGTVGTIGERLTPFFIIIAKELVGVSVEDVNDIYTGKFEPWSLIRLHPSRGVRPSHDEPTSSIDISATGTLTVKKRNHAQSEYGTNPLVYMHAFLNYTYMYGRLFGTEHPDVVSAMNRFAAFILDKSEHYSWKKCLEYAMKHHLPVKANTIHCAASWLDHPRRRPLRSVNAPIQPQPSCAGILTLRRDAPTEPAPIATSVPRAGTRTMLSRPVRQGVAMHYITLIKLQTCNLVT